MNKLLVKTTALCYKYKKTHTILSGMDMQVEAGSIYGFLGANGSGKTTTLRLLLGLLEASEGSIQLFGKSLCTNRSSILQRTGSLIESPSLYGQLTAGENLGVYRKIYGASKQRINEVLNMVGLHDTGNKAVKNFSLGMKQRLAIGLALLPKPDLLILDEPANGLDPNGIIDLRKLLTMLNKAHGITIIVCSHILSEIEKMATHIGIISGGKMRLQASMEALELMQRKHRMLNVQTSDNEAAYKLLVDYKPQLHLNKLSVPYDTADDVSRINRVLTRNNLDVYMLQPKENSLEQLFIELTTGKS